MATKKITREEYGGIEAWNELFEYVEHEILNYTEDMRLPRQFILRLEGLSKGNFKANKFIKPMAKYQYQDILTAYKVAKVLVGNKSDFKDDEHKFNYISAIAEKKLNDVVKARLSKQKTMEKAKEIDLSVQINTKAEYKAKSKDTGNSEILDSLW